jgi:hypothetical protein
LNKPIIRVCDLDLPIEALLQTVGPVELGVVIDEMPDLKKFTINLTIFHI